MDVLIKELHQEHMEEALSLIWNVFCEYEAPDYTKEGMDEFDQSIHDKEFMSNLRMFGAYLNGEITGVIATRNQGTHIALFFVDGRHHRQGIGRNLFQRIVQECAYDTITVNSSPYAIPVYHKLCFHDTEEEQLVHGLRFTPMEFKVIL